MMALGLLWIQSVKPKRLSPFTMFESRTTTRTSWGVTSGTLMSRAHNADCSVAQVQAAATLGGESLSYRQASQIAYAIRSENATFIAEAVANSSLTESSNTLMSNLEQVQYLRETGMTTSEITQYMQTLGDVQVFRLSATFAD